MLRELTRMQWIVDLAIALSYIVLFALVPLLGFSSGVENLLTVLLLAAGLAVRRRSPGLALVLAWTGAVAQMALMQYPGPLDAAIPPVVYACAAYGSRGVRWSAFTSSLVGAGIAGTYVARTLFLEAMHDRSRDELASAIGVFGRIGVLTAVTLLLAWTLGLLVATARRSRRNRQEADAASQQVAAEQERTRIARDMHDVVAHSLAVVIAQSDGARLLGRADPDAVDEALETIGSVSRAALADVRVLLQQLRYEGTTSVQPGLGDLDALFAQFRGSGLELAVARDPELGRAGTAVELAAFRIVQESLTNALRHGDLRLPAEVVLARTPHGLEVEVRNALDPARAPRHGGGGHGLIGMRERAASVQGDLKAGVEGDGFRVRAFLPSGGTAAIPMVRPLPIGAAS